MSNFYAKLPALRTTRRTRWAIHQRWGDEHAAFSNADILETCTPYLNPACDRLRKKLRKQKMKWTEYTDDDGFIHFKEVSPS